MLDQIKHLLKSDKEPIVLDISEIPEWTGGQETSARDALRERAAISRSHSLAAIDRLGAVVETLDAAAAPPADVPAKLAAVVQRSRPAFIKSVTSHLSRDIPEDPEGFYASAAEVLKGCIAGLQGKGKYLARVYVEEMKEFKSALRDLGNEINSMTEVLKSSREWFATAEDVRRMWGEISSIRSEYISVTGRMQKCEERLKANKETISGLENRIAGIRDSPAYHAAMDTEAAVDGLIQQQDRISARFQATLRTAGHVFRKAGKAFERSGRPDLAALVEEILACVQEHPDHLQTPRDRITKVMPEVMQCVREGEVPLKNREERHLFSDISALEKEMDAIAAEHREIEVHIESERRLYASSEAVREMEALRVKLQDIRADQEKDLESIVKDEHRLEELEEAYARLTSDLGERASALAGVEVTVRIPDLTSAL